MALSPVQTSFGNYIHWRPKSEVILVHPGCELRHIEDMNEVAIPYLRAQPGLSSSPVSSAIQQHDGRRAVLHLDVQDQIGELLIHRAAALLPLGFDDEVVRPSIRVVRDEVAILFSPVDTHTDVEMPGIDGLPQDASGSKAVAGYECVPSVCQSGQDEPLQDCARVVSLGAARDLLGHGV